MSKVGLVTTFRFVPTATPDADGQATLERCWSVLSSFLLFHLAKGVDHVFLYADADDGSNQVYLERIADNFHASQVSVDVRNEAQRERQQATCRLWGELGSFSATEVPARQSLNAEDALRKAGEMGLDWLLHLDVDELFYTSEASVQSHFERLNGLGVEQMTYANHEAVPYREDVQDYFCEVDLFRVNHLTLPLSHAVGESTRFWRRRTGHGQYMLAYDNGKAAVKVLPGKIVPQSVHRWKTVRLSERDCNPIGHGAAANSGAISPPEGQEVGREKKASSSCGSESEGSKTVGQKNHEEGNDKATVRSRGHLVNRSALPDPRELRLDEFLECSDPCILHYPSCGLDWLRDKYKLLGSFPSSWFGGSLPIAPSFHLDARNAAVGAVARPQDSNEFKGAEAEEEDRSRKLFRKEVMLSLEDNRKEVRAQLDHGVLRIISGPASVIDRARKVRGAPGSRLTPAVLLSAATEGAQHGLEAGPEGRMERGGGAPAALAAALGGSVPTASSASSVTGNGSSGTVPHLAEGDSAENVAAAADFENSWILSACLREFL